jgi:predicted nucleic-acid-binding Zn-ribbon protein
MKNGTWGEHSGPGARRLRRVSAKAAGAFPDRGPVSGPKPVCSPSCRIHPGRARFPGRGLATPGLGSPAALFSRIFYQPELDVVRNAMLKAGAAVETASERPNPALSLTPVYSTNPPASISLTITITSTIRNHKESVMKNGKCPKCGSDKVYCGVDVYPKSGPFGSNSIPISLTSIAAVDNYVCTECGYLERYVAESEKLREIARKWQQCGPAGSTKEKAGAGEASKGA